jgi:hypothetical protein
MQDGVPKQFRNLPSEASLLSAQGASIFQVNTSHTWHTPILGQHFSAKKKRENKTQIDEDGDRFFIGHSRGSQGQHPSGLLLLAHTTVPLEESTTSLIIK